MADISATLEAKSDQLNATDIFGAEPVIRVRDVQLKESAEQPIWVYFDGDNNRPWKPSKGMRRILEEITESGQGSFLAVLKAFGKQNENYLSFPVEGYTLALDFKVTPSIFKLLDRLDELVLQYGGRLYLAKDARMTEQTFKASYPRWQEFEAVRSKYHAIGKFASLQSKRLGLA